MRLLPLLLLALVLPFLPARAQTGGDKVLNVYNWTDYIDPKALERFTKETGIKVQYDVYDSLETLEGKLLAGHSGYDIVVPTSEPTFSRLIRAGALQPLDKPAIPNLANEDPVLMQRVESSDPGNKYGAIYLWGTIGLGQNVQKIHALAPNAPTDSWDLLFKPENARLLAPCGIDIMDSAIDVIPSVLKYLGKDPNSTSTADLAAVEKTLMAIRPYVRSFASGGAVESMASGEMCLTLSYSGDIIQAEARAQEAKRDFTVAYAAPKEGAQLWFDMLAVPKDAPHPQAAMQFINFILQPDVMAGITDTVHYANAIPKTLPLIAPDIAHDPNIYPPAAQMRAFFTVKAVPQAVARERSRMWERFKAGS
jgi:putrescine transport system substrate-binding protein